MWYVCAFYTIRSPSLFCIRKLYIYISCSWVILTLRHCHICICIDMFVYVIQYNFCLYFILVILFYTSPVHGLFYRFIIVTSDLVFICLWILYPCFLWYVGVIYTIYSLVVLHLGKISIHIPFIWFVIPLSPSSLTCIHNNGLTPLLKLVVTCIETHIFIPSFSISHIFISIVFFFWCLLLSGQLFTLNIQHSNTYTLYHLYTIL